MDRIIVLIMIGLVYAARPLSCVVARAAATADPRFDTGFDFDGMVAGLGTLFAILLAVPVIRIAWLILRARPADAGRAVNPNRYLPVQGLVWAALAAPTFSQMQYLAVVRADPVRPILLSCLAWGVVTAILWWAARRRADIMPAIGRSGIVVAALTVLPKLLLLPSLMVPAG